LCPEQAPDIKVMEDHFLRAHVNKKYQCLGSMHASIAANEGDETILRPILELIQAKNRSLVRHVKGVSRTGAHCVVTVWFILERRSTAVRSVDAVLLAKTTLNRTFEVMEYIVDVIRNAKESHGVSPLLSVAASGFHLTWLSGLFSMAV
ncbi:hypothetical protein TELCIR_26068, partial [Teladorsagia circumcincta]